MAGWLGYRFYLPSKIWDLSSRVYKTTLEYIESFEMNSPRKEFYRGMKFDPDADVGRTWVNGERIH